MKKTVLVIGKIHSKGIDLLENNFNVVHCEEINWSEIKSYAPDIVGIIVRTYKLPELVYQDLPSLKVISKHGVGVDNINLALATKNNIAVVNTPRANSQTVAEYIIGLLFCLSRKICIANEEFKKGNYGIKRQIMGNEMKGKILGIFGLGNIGSILAKKAIQGLEMEVISYDPIVNPEYARKLNVKLVNQKEEILKKADFISLNLPLNKNTVHYIDRKELRMMKKTAFIINAARGQLINEMALAEAVKEQWIAGAAVDVFSTEPPEKSNPVLHVDNIIITPHIAGQTEEAMQAMAIESVQQVIEMIQGQVPKNVLNPEALIK